MAGLRTAGHQWPATTFVLLVSLVLGALYAGQLVVHATSTSATVDEPVHILAGYRHLTCGDYAFNPEHPPLVKQVAALLAAAHRFNTRG